MTDILIFGGQSNMQGQTESCPCEAPVCGGYEYKHRSGTLVPLMHPVGEDMGEMLLGAHLGHGSLVPAFVRAYVAESGADVVAIHAAKGATRIDEWQKGGTRYAAAAEKIAAGTALARREKQVRHIAYVWLQGESDALAGLGATDYEKALIAYKNALKEDVGIQKFGIIKVGYFAGKAADEEIMAAQERVCTDPDFAMLTRVCGELSLRKKYVNPDAPGHYNNAAMDIIGTLAGSALARILRPTESV